MRGNIPIPELPSKEEVWLMVLVTSVRERRTKTASLVVQPLQQFRSDEQSATSVHAIPRAVWP
jgi:hypothetical protein